MLFNSLSVNNVNNTDGWLIKLVSKPLRGILASIIILILTFCKFLAWYFWLSLPTHFKLLSEIFKQYAIDLIIDVFKYSSK